ncbi:hypothetical protein ACU52_11905 [Xylanibacter rarus]|uniref:Uncharacterized protein n=1 Tax=Xylanibacter rarus TaxID=1676614 RepID=A0A8E1QZV7_9BACT|nr:hypothetical protein ACU52_11905 [Xylanibacter rarus]
MGMALAITRSGQGMPLWSDLYTRYTAVRIVFRHHTFAGGSADGLFCAASAGMLSAGRTVRRCCVPNRWRVWLRHVASAMPYRQN